MNGVCSAHRGHCPPECHVNGTLGSLVKHARRIVAANCQGNCWACDQNVDSCGCGLSNLRQAVLAWDEKPTKVNVRADYDRAQAVGPYRVGRKLGRTLYRDDECVGMLDDEGTARFLAGAANYYLQLVAPLSDAGDE